MILFETDRLLLRRWQRRDRQPFARLNADSRVMEFFPKMLTPDESGKMVDRIEAHFAARGFGLCATEARTTGEFIGFIGLAAANFDAHFTPCVEIGWRLAAEYWGRGLATEGAREIARYALSELKLCEIVAMTAPDNVRSRRVMDKLGMTRDPADDFDHPLISTPERLRRHVLYRLRVAS